MKTVLITGGTGCLGSNLAVKLVESGYKVKVFHRPTSNLIGLKDIQVEHFTGDIRNKRELKIAMMNCDYVFHTAAMVSFWKKKRDVQYEINVLGTRNVAELCIELGIQRLIHTSSIAALGYRNDGNLINENTEYNWGNQNGYRYTKHLSEIEILKGVDKKLDAVIVNPSVIIGARDVYFNGGQIIRDIVRGKIPVYVAGGTNLVGVNDVVNGQISALHKGKTGERYILANANLTHKQVFDLVAKVLNGTAPKIKVPVWITKQSVKMIEFISNFTNKQPRVTSDLIAGIGKNNWYSIEKAKRELGYNPSPIEEAIREAYQWYIDNKLI